VVVFDPILNETVIACLLKLIGMLMMKANRTITTEIL